MCYTAVLVDLLHEERETSEWRSLHVGAQRGVNCDDMLALAANIFSETLREVGRPSGGSAARIFQIHSTAFMASLDVKTAFDVAKPAVVSRTPTLTG